MMPMLKSKSKKEERWKSGWIIANGDGFGLCGESLSEKWMECLVQLLLHIHRFILSFLNQEIRKKLNIKIGGFCGTNTLPQADF